MLRLSHRSGDSQSGEVFLPMKIQVALAGGKRICEASHVVVFDEDDSFIFNKMSVDKSAQRGVRQLHVRCLDSS